MMEAAAKDFSTAASLYDRQAESQLKMENSTLRGCCLNSEPPSKTKAEAAKQKAQAIMTDEQALAMAQRAYAGDKTALQTIGGRGIERQLNFNKINADLNKIMKDNGDPPDKIAKANAEMAAYAAGQSSEARAGGTRTAQLEMVTSVLQQAIPQARAASQSMSRGDFVAYNKAIQAGETQFSDPKLKAFNIANIQLAELWARAMNPTEGNARKVMGTWPMSQLRAADGPRAYRSCSRCS